MDPKNCAKTTFMTDIGNFFYNVTSFGLKNAYATCQEMRNMALKVQVRETETCLKCTWMS